MILRFFIILFGISFFTACEERSDFDLDLSSIEGLVVESILTDEMKIQEIKLGALSGELNVKGGGVSGARVQVSHSNGSYVFVESNDKPGEYLSEDPFAIELKKDYQLDVELESMLYKARSSAVEASAIKDFSILQLGQKDSFYISDIGVEYSYSEQSMYEFLVEWKLNDQDSIIQAKLQHFVLNSINIGQVIGQDEEGVYFPGDSRIILRKYDLNDDFAEYIRGMVIESKYKGGLFEGNPGNLHSNISNGAYGFFALCPVQVDTIYIR